MNKQGKWHLEARVNARQEFHMTTNLFEGNAINHMQSIQIFIDGYVIPRREYFGEYCKYEQEELIRLLYCKFGKDFIKYIKGVFCLVIINPSSCSVYTDHHALMKYFYYANENSVIIANNLDDIASRINLEVDIESVAEFTLLSHYINGDSLFKGVKYAKPGQFIEFSVTGITEYTYWNPQELFPRVENNYKGIPDLAFEWRSIIKDYIDYLSPSGVSLTLTGGIDSRLVLAGVYASKAFPHLYTYGDPQSSDSIIAREVAKKINFEHDIHYMSNPTTEWFDILSDSIIESGNTLVNIHRAHRLDAAQNEKKIQPNNNMIFTGLVGGEYTKKPFYNDLIIPRIFEWLTPEINERKAIERIRTSLVDRGLLFSKVNESSLFERLRAYASLNKGVTERQTLFNFSYNFYGCSHHNQDSYLYINTFKYLVNPFMDVDYLTMLSKSKHWYVNRVNYNRIFHSEFMTALTHQLAPVLSQIPYGKKGHYCAEDILLHKTRYLRKRVCNYIAGDNVNYHMNFPLDTWFYEYCKKQLTDLKPSLSQFFDYDYLSRIHSTLQSNNIEASWHVISNPINIALNVEYYEKI